MFMKSQLYEENYQELPLLEKTRGRDTMYHHPKSTSNPRSGFCLPTINVEESNRKYRAKDLSPSSKRSSLPSINPRGYRIAGQQRNSDPQPIQLLTTEMARSGWKDRSPLVTTRIPRKKKGRKAAKASPDHSFSKENIPEPKIGRIIAEPRDDRETIRCSTHESFGLNLPEPKSGQIIDESRDDQERIRCSTHESFDLSLPTTSPYYDGSHASKNIHEPPSRICEPPGMPNKTHRSQNPRSHCSTQESFEANACYDDSCVSSESSTTTVVPSHLTSTELCQAVGVGSDHVAMKFGVPRAPPFTLTLLAENIPEPTSERPISEPQGHGERIRCSTHGNVDLNACYDGSHASNLLSWIRGTYVAIANARSKVLEMEDPQEAMNIYCNITLQWVRILNMWSTGHIGAENFDKVLNIERPCIQMPTNIYALYRAIVDAAQGEGDIGDAELTLGSSGSTIIGKWVMQCIRYTGVSCMV